MAPPVPLPFFCELCRKGYARISELEVHETSYDHHHRKRAADLRTANRDVARREREAAKEGTIRVLGAEEHTSKKSSSAGKRGFKSAFGQHDKTVFEAVQARSGKRQEIARGKTISELYGAPQRGRRDSIKHDKPATVSRLESSPSGEESIPKTGSQNSRSEYGNLGPSQSSIAGHSETLFKQEPSDGNDDYESSYPQPPSRTAKLEAEISGLSYPQR